MGMHKKSILGKDWRQGCEMRAMECTMDLGRTEHATILMSEKGLVKWALEKSRRPPSVRWLSFQPPCSPRPHRESRGNTSGIIPRTNRCSCRIATCGAAAGDFIVGGIAPAEASAIKIEDGQVNLTVEVDASTDLQTWKPATTVNITVPVEGEKGLYILKSK